MVIDVNRLQLTKTYWLTRLHIRSNNKGFFSYKKLKKFHYLNKYLETINKTNV